MLRRVLIAGTALAVIAVFGVTSQPVVAGSCAVLSEKAIGLKQSEAANRAQKQLNHKINRWAAKNGYKSVRTTKMSTQCIQKGAIASCTVAAKVCG